ncbi:hypothetical protein HMPREF1153_0202 [Selenomonas sp. CM52]|nr:hypothetical protein HMPREF1153_0202 [Selenomonas sp. CM52]
MIILCQEKRISAFYVKIKNLKKVVSFTMKVQEVKPTTQTDWIIFIKGSAQYLQSGRLCV